MKNILIAPDSFKGTISSLEVCEILKKSFGEVFRDTDIKTLPIADGGEGSIDAFLHVKSGKRLHVNTKDPYFKPMKSFYGLLDDGTAIIEMATTAGLPLVKEKNPLLTTTYGVGEQIKDAIEKGSKRIIICLGGSATNDAGCGLACALGAKFLDKHNKEFIPTGGTLKQIKDIDLTNLKKLLKGVHIQTMCDINNPFYGKNGAAFVFAPQKGADKAMVKTLDENLQALNEKVKELFGVDLQQIKGSGAAGGMGGGMVAFLGSKLEMGIEIILENANFEKLLKNASLVISGEGKIDSQSIDGKAISGIAKKCQKAGVPLVCIVGGYEGDLQKFYDIGVYSIFSTNKMPQKLADTQACQNLKDTATNVAKSLKLMF